MAAATKKATGEKKQKDYKTKLRIKLSAFDHFILDKSVKEIVRTVSRSGARVVGPIPLPTKRNSFPVLRSPFVYKNHFDKFEMTLHRRLVDVLDPDQQVLYALQKLEVASGVTVDIKMV
jgi:small subunit ribosomal protein S10